MREQISANKRKTVLLILGTIVFVGAVGYVLGLVVSGGSTQAAIAALAIALLISIGMSWTSYRYGDRIVLSTSRARPVTHEEEPRLHNVVEGLALAAGIPKPAVYVVPEQAPNAFATGRDPEHSSIAVTQGLLDMMNRVELEGVVGHEMSHVRDRDILLGTVVATLVGVVVLLAEFMLRWFWWGGMGGRRNNQGGSEGNAILFAVGLALAVLAPFFAQIIKLDDVAGARVPGRRGGRHAHALSARPRVGAPQGRRRPHADADREQRDRAPLAESAIPDARRGEPLVRETSSRRIRPSRNASSVLRRCEVPQGR